jgi:outer membrane protein assembly factor BamB
MFLALVLAATPAAPVPPTPVADWKSAIKPREFRIDWDNAGAGNGVAAARKAGLSASFELNEGRFDGTFTFQRKGGPKVTFADHADTAVVVRGDALYVAKFNGISSGCTVVAYDLTTGKKAWEKALEGIGPVSHSKYRNRVAMAVEKHPTADHFALVITGWEAFGRYVEVIDLGTGKQLAHKTYESAGVPPR